MSAPYRPLSLLAELTYRCNLQCPYCYNPLDLRAYRRELDAATWCRVLDEAADLGVLQVHFSGGEPTLRAEECVALVRRARERGMYSNLITQGTFLTDDLLDRLLDAGLDHIQISVQAPHAELADQIAGARVHERKVEALTRVARRPVALTLNCVLHRHNIDQVEDVIALAERVGVRRVELANAQLYGWAYRNRLALLPTREQVERARDRVREAARRLAGRMEITHVLADYYEPYPKPCMNGWGQMFLTVAPDGRVFPCPAAAAITTLRFENVTEKPLAWIWHESESFNAYRGVSWMPEPCRSCDRREVDWGGCRCQAFLLTGDAGLTDPACSKSPLHGLVTGITEAITAAPQPAELIPRRM
jgi:pyrroloquinoline quinone biosynthesis protein E